MSNNSGFKQLRSQLQRQRTEPESDESEHVPEQRRSRHCSQLSKSRSRSVSPDNKRRTGSYDDDVDDREEENRFEKSTLKVSWPVLLIFLSLFI